MRCPHHPDALALATCTVCGARSCVACAPEHSGLGAPVCAGCADGLPAGPSAARARHAGPSPSSLWAIAALLGVGCVSVGAWIGARRPPRVAPDPTQQMVEAVAGLRELSLAVDAHREAHGALPSSLAQIAPDTLPSAPADPFAVGRTLRLEPSSGHRGGLVAWSVGPDGLDQGGALFDPVSRRGDLTVILE